MDKLVSLAAGLATGHRDYAVLVGAGFSKDAGIPSGWDVLLKTIEPHYITDKFKDSQEKPTTPTPKELEEWYNSNEELRNLGYSQILDLIKPGELERKQFNFSLQH